MTPKFVALLRGMNLGKRRVKNPELCACFEEMGFSSVAAFLASGNVVFEAKGTKTSVARKVERGLADQLGYEVPTIVRTDRELVALSAHVPFAGQAHEKRGKVQVIFLPRKPTPAQVERIRSLATDDDRLEPRDEELFWWPSAGVADSDFDLKGLEKIIGTVTVRTKNTVERLVAKYFPTE